MYILLLGEMRNLIFLAILVNHSDHRAAMTFSCKLQLQVFICTSRQLRFCKGPNFLYIYQCHRDLQWLHNGEALVVQERIGSRTLKDDLLQGSRERNSLFPVCSFFTLKEIRKILGCPGICMDYGMTCWMEAVVELDIQLPISKCHHNSHCLAALACVWTGVGNIHFC